MPLIIHPESTCDVCLESLTYDDPTPPYAIPCGHIFCKECLQRTDPSNCPLCRKPYLPARAKKLITGERTTPDDTTESDLLRRLAVSWDIQEDQLVALLEEVDAWLRSRTDSSNLPLKKAREALGSYKKLKTLTHDNRITIRNLKQGLRHREQAALLDKDTAHAIEQSLIAQVDELRTKLVQCESELEKLRLELSTYKSTKNPLPPPPEPFPLDRLPLNSIPEHFASGSGFYNWHLNEHRNGHQTDRNANAPETIVPQPHGGINPDELQSRFSEDITRGMTSRERKGKYRARKEKEKDRNYDGHRSPTLAPQGTVGQSEGSSSAINTSINGNRNAIIPGATPNQRVIPRSVFDRDDLSQYTGYQSPVDPRDVRPIGLDLHFDNDPTQPTDPYTLTAGMMVEFANGYGAGYQAGSSLQSRVRNGGPTTESAPIYSSLLEPPEPRSVVPLRPLPRWLTDPSDLQSPPSPEPFIPPQFRPTTYEIIAEEAARPTPRWGEPPRDTRHTGQTPPASNLITSAPHVSNPSAPQEDSGVRSALPAPPFSAPVLQDHHNTAETRHRSIPTSTSDHPRPHRRRTTQIDAGPAPDHIVGHASNALIVRPPELHRRTTVSTARPTTNGSPVPTADHTTRPESRTSTARNSMTSWGTIESHGAPSIARTIQSVTDLPLSSFENGAGVRGSVHSESSMISFSRGNPFQIGNAFEESVDRAYNNITPRNRSGSLSETVSTLRSVPDNSQNPDRPLERPPQPHPVALSHAPTTQGSRYTQAIVVPSGQALEPSVVPVQRSRQRSHRHHMSSRRLSPSENTNVRSTQANISVNTTAWTDAGYMTDAPTSDNALGLQLSRSPQITAPTPIVSSRGFLRSFSHDYRL